MRVSLYNNLASQQGCTAHRFYLFLIKKFFAFFRSHLTVHRALHSGITPARLEVAYWIYRIKPWLAMCKVNDLPSVPSLVSAHRFLMDINIK